MNDIQEEIWKDLIYIDKNGKTLHFDGFYQISNKGRVRSYRAKSGGNVSGKYSTTPRQIKISMQNNGYYMFGVRFNDGKTFGCLLHRALCSNFIPFPKDLDISNVQVNHKDENKSNNDLDNLEWCTPKDNTNYGTRTKRAIENGLKTKATDKWKKNNSKGKIHNARSVIGVNIKTNEIIEFESMSCANEYFNNPMASRSVSSTLRGKQPTAYGYKWYYKEDYKKIYIE